MTETTEAESPTRDRILHLVVEAGPISVLELARDLHLTPAGVRRHVAALEEAGHLAVHAARGTGHAGRGRPARRYVATVQAQAALDCSYADLAQDALAYLARVGGPAAVDAFAEHRAAELEALVGPALPSTDLRARTDELAAALSGQGYAASVRQVPGGRAVQLCQGHCPVRDVAVVHPALCEAETRMISRVLGVHVQRLSTLAAGAHVCTTHVPLTRPRGGPETTVATSTGPTTGAATRATTDLTAQSRRPAGVEGER
ncbi:MAG TPA: helix-turn-helix domain-containing protein [Actinotalea sp.]|nr:helix-turn-helix domain-containing protein [Actinotalea sp.]